MQANEVEIQALYHALVQRDQASWDGVWRSWRPRVAGWVRRHPQYAYTGEEVDYFVNRAFEKLWRAVDGSKLERFVNPAQLIQYFKLCVHSAILDELRGSRLERLQAAASSEDLVEIPDARPGVEEDAMARVRRNDLWTAVSRHVRTEEDRVLVVAGLVRGMAPREIALRYPGLFGDVNDVYRLKRNLMDRLSRDKSLREYLS